ncbi:MAG: beta-N-acetylhexosaminidase [Nitrospinaceae bacterium]
MVPYVQTPLFFTPLGLTAPGARGHIHSIPVDPSLNSPTAIAELTGQMLISGFEGARLNAETESLIREQRLGGVILFSRNYENPGQLQSLIQDLQAVAAESSPGRPLFISVDQEGGKVARLTDPFTAFPEAQCLGRAGSADLARRLGQALGRELAAVGVNMDYAPVLDVNSNPENPVIGSRAFSADPLRTAVLGVAFMDGLQQAGVIPVGKHFPGHGDTTTDSHLELPCVAKDADSLEQVELAPFAAAVKHGLQVMMTAHVVYPAWDPEAPATFSPAILDSLLRRRMGFDGIILSDDLEMKAVDKNLEFETLPRRGVAAGLDVFLLCNNPEKVKHLHRILTEDVEAGRIPLAAVRRSVDRIQKVKAGIPEPSSTPPDFTLWQEEHLALAREMEGHLPA